MSRDHDETYRDELTAHLGAIRSQVRRVARDCDEADELTQECVARLLEKERLYHRKGPFSHWVSVVVRRFALNRLRKQKTWERKKVEVTSMDAFAEQDRDRKYSEDDVRTILQQFVHLTPAQRDVLRMRYLEDMSQKDIADRLGVTPQAVSQRVQGAVRRLRDRARYAKLGWLAPLVWLKNAAVYSTGKGWTMFGKHKLASFSVCSLLVLALASMSWGDAGALATVADVQGVVHSKGVADSRWAGAAKDDVLAIGAWLKTSARGANLVSLRTAGGTQLILGPGGLLELTGADACTLTRGLLDVELVEGVRVVVSGPKGTAITLRQSGMVRVGEAGLQLVEAAPDWLAAYKDDRPEPLGSLLAKIDGRNVALSIGYHKVQVDIRDQIARTVIEESFVNHTPMVLEGVFYFPLPAGASISSFGMWIGDELVEGEIVEKQRARQIYETILRENRDPGLLEWQGGNIFKARVYPIGAEKRIRIAYTQVLPKQGQSYRYSYRLNSDLLRSRPLSQLAISVSVASTQALEDVHSPSHELRARVQKYTASLEFSAEEYTPDRDFQLDIRTAPASTPISFVPHLRAEQGYFLIWLDGPALGEEAGLAVREPQNFVFLADTSASMDPSKRVQQEAFLDAFLTGLRAEDRFNLAVCDVETRFAFTAPQPVDAVSSRKALDFLQQRHSLGWTDLDAGIAAAVDASRPGTQIVYVGDAIPTTGDAEPAAQAERLKRVLRGRQLQVHAVAVGSSYEDLVLKALASVGGSLHKVEDRQGAVRAADQLLERLTHPVLRELRVEIEGLETAAVYPRELGSLPAGQQHVVVGRYLPGTSEGPVRVVVRGTLAGKPVEHVLEVALEEGSRSNAFIPRLWARHHLEHLLGQVPSALLQERIVGLSEDYQIITPYTSFLVLESDADRARFEVERAFKMRDGEEFFAEGRQLASRELVREQMQAAQAWRLQLKRRYFEMFSQLGRTSVAYGWDQAPFSEYASGPLGLQRDYRLPASSSSSLRDDHQWAVPMSERRLELDVLKIASRQQLYEANESIGKLRYDALDPWGGLPFGLASSVGDKRERLAQSLEAGRHAWRPAPPQYLLALFPSLGVPYREQSSGWPAEVRERLAPLRRRAAIEAGAGGWRFSIEAFRMNKRGIEVPAGHTVSLLGAERWASRHEAPFQASTLRWFGDGQRAVANLADMLARERAGEDGDARAWPAPFSGLWFEPLDGVYASYEPELREAGDSLILVLRLQQKRVLELVFDAPSACLLEVRSFHNEKLTGRQRFGDFIEVGGHTWPQLYEAFDGDDRCTWRTRIEITRLEVAAYGKAWQAAVEPAQAALVLPATLPSLPEAKSRVEAGTAGFCEHLQVADFRAGYQDWDACWNELEAAFALEEGKPGLLRLRREALFFSRRVEAGRQLLLEQVPLLVAGAPRDALYLAESLLGHAQQLQARERLPLLQQLEPLYAAAEPRLEAVLVWQGRLHDLYAQLGWHERDLALLLGMQQAWPDDWQSQDAYASALFARRELEAAFAHLEGALERGLWLEHERRQIIQRGAQLRLDAKRLADFLRYVDAHAAALDWDQWIYEQVIAAHVMLDQVEEADALIASWLAAEPEEGDSRAINQMNAAVSHALGQFWGLFSYRQVDDRFFPQLAEACERLAERADLSAVVQRMFSHPTFRTSKLGSAQLRRDFARLQAQLTEAAPELVLHWVGRLRNAGFDPEDGGKAWQEIFDTVYRRWQEDRHVNLAQTILWYGSIERQLELRRQERAWDASVTAASNVLFLLMRAPWTQEREDEAFELIELSVEPSNPDPLADQVQLLTSVVDWALAGRAQVAEQTLPEANTLSRRALEEARQSWQTKAREAVLAKLQVLQSTAPQGYARWLLAEALYLRARLEQPAATLFAGFGDLFAGIDSDSLTFRGSMMARRCVESMASLAIQPRAPAALADSLLATARRHSLAGSELYDWHFLELALLVCLDRNAEAEALLVGILAEEDRFVARPWRVLLGALYAERGALAEAIEVYEALAGDQELGDSEASLLSAWYLALEQDAAADEAKVRSFALREEWELENWLWSQIYVYVRSGDEIPPELDPELPLMLRAWLRKASYPSRATSIIQQLYNATKDFRLLACLAEGVLGHSQEGIYDYLQNLQPVLDAIHEEATADQIADQLDGLRASCDDALSRRALAFLDFLVARRAATQTQGAEIWTARALASFEAAFADPWLPREAALAAGLLRGLGKLEPEALAVVQRREIEEIYRQLPRSSDDFPIVARHWAELQWIYGQRVSALGVLRTALTEVRRQGLVPQPAAILLMTLSSYLKQSGEYLACEELWRAELALPYAQTRAWEHELELFGCFVEAYPDHTVSAGRGSELYAFTEAWLIAELGTRRNTQVNQGIVERYCQLMQRAKPRETSVPDDLKDFAFRELPAILALYDFRDSYNVIASIVSQLERIVGNHEALRFLIVRAENEPRWLELAGQEIWSTLGYKIAELRTRVSLEAGLEERLLSLVLPVLERDLRLRSFRNTGLFHVGSGYFWSEQAETFAGVAQRVAKQRSHDAGVLQFVAEYLYHGLHRWQAGITVLQDAYRRGILGWEGRALLVDYLQGQEQYAVSLPIIMSLVEEVPGNADYRRYQIVALSHAGAPGSAAAAADSAMTYFKKQQLWEESAVSVLADACLRSDLLARGADLYGEAINLRKRFVTLDDWSLSHYYSQQAHCLAGLDRLSEAVDAAAGGILAWSQGQASRAEALETLVRILIAARDLDAYVDSCDVKTRNEGVDSPVIRRALGEAYFRRKAYAQAITQLSAALRNQPNDEPTRARLLEAYDKLDDQAGAVACLRAAIANAPRLIGQYEELGRRLRLLGDAMEAERAYTSLAEALPHEAEGHASLARHFLATERPQQAAVQWQQVVRVRSDEPAGYLEWARAAIAGNDPERARQVLQQVLARDWKSRFGNVHQQALELLRGL